MSPRASSRRARLALLALLPLTAACAAERSTSLNRGVPGASSEGPASGANGPTSGNPGGAGGAGGSAPTLNPTPGPVAPPAAPAPVPAAPGSRPPTDGGAADAASPPPPPSPPPPVSGMPPAVDPPPSCGVSIDPLSPQRFSDIPAGPGYRFRLAARVAGGRTTAPTWRWSIVHESNQAVPYTLVDADPAVIEFPTEMTGRYTILAEIAGEAGCQDRRTAFAVVPDRLFAKFRVRATPPAGALALFEADLQISAGTPVTKTIDLQRGYPVTIDPQDERGFELPAFYVRIAGRSSTARLDGYVVPSRRMGFRALLELGQRYDVLLVPDGEPGQPARAPLAHAGLLAEEFGLQSFRVDRGIAVSGAVAIAAGPLRGARVRLRAGALPSTVGETGDGGRYALQARAGQFEVRVLPPEGSGLPEAQLPQSAGVILREGDSSAAVDFTYAAAAPVRLDLTVLAPTGAPLPGVRVLIESEPGALPRVGSFTLGGVAVPAAGLVRRLAISDGAGLASFAALPRTRYRVTLAPPEGAPADAAITTANNLDLTSLAAAATGRTVTLGRRTRLLGRLTPAAVAAGLIVKAVDTGEDGAGRTVTTTVGGDGRYQLPTDPDRVYRLFIEPPADRRVPRIPLEPVRARSSDLTLDRALPGRLSLSGAALENGVAAAGVVIQVFCVGSAPTCIDPEAPDITSTPPIDETSSGPDGRYQLYVPDPGQ